MYGGGTLYDEIVHKLGQPAALTGGEAENAFTPGQMTYARYSLHRYVLPAWENKEPYRDLKRTGANVRGFIRVLLFKRLESSVEAFRRTVRALLRVHDGFVAALDQGIVPAGEAAQSVLYDGHWTDETDLLEALEQTALDGRRYAPDGFDLPRLRRDLQNDGAVLREMDALLAPITPAGDGKLQALRDLLRTTLAKQKALIFTQFEATAEYLSQNLPDLPRTAYLSGRHRTAGPSFMRTIARFAPRANPGFVDPAANPIDVLVATDVLSEGLNLQDCSLVINYDLHWNPVRLIQRVGRVDRVGSEAERIALYNFLPERGVERVLRLEEILTRRIAEIQEFIGEDGAILHPEERINDADLYAAYTRPPAEDKDDESSPAALAVDFTEIEERIRQLRRDQPELMRRVQELPPGVRAARRRTMGADKDDAFFCFATDGFEQFLLADRHGAIRVAPPEEVLACLECGPDEPALTPPSGHNALVSRALHGFEEEAARRDTDRRTGPRLTPGQQYAVRHLGALLKTEANDDRRLHLSTIERALRARLPEAALRELNTIRRLGLVGDPLRQRLEQAYRDLDLGRYLRPTDEQVSVSVARVVCSEAFL